MKDRLPNWRERVGLPNLLLQNDQLTGRGETESAAGKVVMAMGAVTAAAADAAVTFLWVLLSSALGAGTVAVTSYLSLAHPYAPLLVTASLLFVLLSAFNLLCDALGGARFSPTDVAAFYAAGLSRPSLFSVALRLPAQVTVPPRSIHPKSISIH
jgi:hypothetical protein